MNKFMTWQTEHSCNLVINFTLLCLITTLAVGCKNNSSTSNTSQSAIVPTTNPAIAIQPLRVVTVPTESSTYKKKNLQELGDYLQKIIQRPVSFEVAKNYEAAVDLIVKEDVYMAYLGPLTYIKSHQLNPHIEPLVLAIDKDTGRPWYTSVIVANTKSLCLT
jgi:phosphonate transport system substrate-binding protein